MLKGELGKGVSAVDDHFDVSRPCHLADSLYGKDLAGAIRDVA